MNKWIVGARPRTLPAAVAPVVVGTALAGDQLDIFRAVLALMVSLGLQVGVNFANDYSDGIKGSDEDRVGPLRLTASGVAKAEDVRNAAFISFFFAALVGLYLSFLTSPFILLIGAASILAAWGYTGGKNPYGYRGFGEISVFVFFGVVATVGTFYLQTERITSLSVITSIPIGSLACAILVINNIRDRPQDERVGKRTLAVRLGDRRSRAFFASLLLLAHLSALATLRPWVGLTLLALPLTYSLLRKVNLGVQGPSLIPLLAKTGQLQLIFSALFAVGLIL